jgi:hypothetical protein
MSYVEKIDVLELLINIIKEHEEKLDNIVSRLEDIEFYKDLLDYSFSSIYRID